MQCACCQDGFVAVLHTVFYRASESCCDQRLTLALQPNDAPLFGQQNKKITDFCVFDFSITLHPSATLIHLCDRMTEKVTQVGPYKVPPGVIVFPCLYSILMYSKNWDDPHKFDPDRWMNDPAYATDPSTGVPRFIPFGVGPKACIAQQLAMVQCKVRSCTRTLLRAPI